MATTDIRQKFPVVYEAKKNRCATSRGLFEFIALNEKQITIPVSQQGEALRNTLKDFITAVSSEYQTTAHTNSELILCALNGLSLSDSSKCFQTQFHCGITCSEEEFTIFEDECAQGIPSSVRINHFLSAEQLTGFPLFAGAEFSSIFLFRITTALTDFMAHVSNSDLQQQYSTSMNLWMKLRFSVNSKVGIFIARENEAFALLTSAAAAAGRSVPGPLDRGLSILKSLPTTTQTSIANFARKKNIPENRMNRDWVTIQIQRLERESAPQFSWANETDTTSNRTCNRFQSGTCTSGDKCKYKHAIQVSDQNIIALPATSADSDMVDIVCLLKHSPQCTPSFQESKSYWANITDPNGKPFALPKSCKQCRDYKKFLNSNNTSLFTALDSGSESGDYAEAADDYFSHSVSMSGSNY